MWKYTEKVMDHFYNPRNVGEIKDADGIGEVGSIVCGDALKLYIKVKDGKIVDAKFQTFGCGSAIASSSILTEMIKGKTIEEALKITNKDIAEALGGLPKEKMHCSVMGKEALEAAIMDYKKRKGEKIETKSKKESKKICYCFDVYEDTIRKTIIENRLKTVDDVTHYTKSGGGCGGCRSDIEKILEDVWNKELADIKKEEESKHKEKDKNEFNNLTLAQKIIKIQEILEKEVNPTLAIDGGSIELIDLEGNIVKVKFHGACSTCPSGTLTIKNLVERVLKEKLSSDLQVQQIK